MDKVVQAYVCKWLLDSTPLGQRVIRVRAHCLVNESAPSSKQ